MSQPHRDPFEDLPTVLQDAYQLIHETDISPVRQTEVMNRTLTWWKQHVNRGFLTYRKSVSDESNYALLDWHDAYPGTPWFDDHRGVRFLDLLGGYGIYNVGRRHPRVIETVRAQLEKQALHSQELLDPLRAYAARALSLVMPPNLTYFFFTNSGTESVEACLKMAMLATGRNTVVACVNGFHGKTLGSLSCTSKATFREPFVHALNRTIHVPFNEPEALASAFLTAQAIGEPIAAVLIEPIQGEGGIHVGTKTFLSTARTLCDRFGAVLIFDEVQSGMGRTGAWWACQHSNVTPDLMAIGKAMGGGVMPAGACVGTDQVWKKYVQQPFLFTTTFGGNPLAMAAAISTLDVIHSQHLLRAADERGCQFLAGLDRLKQTYPHVIQEIRGKGLMIGIEFVRNEDGIAFAKEMFNRNILTAGTLVNAKTIRVEPALTISETDVDWALHVMNEVLHLIGKMRAKL